MIRTSILVAFPSVTYQHRPRPLVTKRFPCKLSCSHLQEYLMPCQVWDTSNIHYLSVQHCKSFTCTALLRVPAHNLSAVQTLFPVSQHRIYIMILAHSSKVILPYFLTWAVSPFLCSFPFGEKTQCTQKVKFTWMYVSSMAQLYHILGSLALYPLIYCLRSVNFNSDYFYCCLIPVVSPSPLPVLLSPLVVPVPFLVPAATPVRPQPARKKIQSEAENLLSCR